MKEILITSSVLIVVILLARKLFRGKVSQKLIYAAWLLVALRLMVPIQFGQSQYSVTTFTEKIENQSKPIQQVQEVLQEPVAGPSRAELYEQLLDEYLQQSADPDLPEVYSPITPEIQEQIEEQVDQQITAPTLSEVLTAVWIVGVVVMAVWFITANLLYLYKAKQGAVPFAACEAPVAVRVSSNVPTPCLVGFFRPVIYLTPASTENAQALNHVLTHELAHLRHWDHIWSILRCVCLCVYWFDPLVWIAAHQSRRDCELACDESALKKLGDEERIAYGKTLLATVTQSMSPTHLIETATAMNETKKQLKERVNFIVKKPENLLIAAICLILVAAITAGCAFTGSKINEPTVTEPTVTEPSGTEPDVTAPPETTVPSGTTEPAPDPPSYNWNHVEQRPQRIVYYMVWTEFDELLDETQAQDWRAFYNDYIRQVIADQSQDEMLLVTFIKRYNISREAFDGAVDKLIAKCAVLDWNVRSEEIEIPNADIIYTFDNDLINEYYKKDAPVYVPPAGFTVLDGDHVPDADVLPEYEPGSITLYDPLMDDYNFDRTYRIAYYRCWTVFQSLLNEDQLEEYQAWLKNFQKQTEYGKNQREMLLVAFIKRFGIPREAFEQAVAYYKESAAMLGYDLSHELYEAPNTDIIYTFDNQIINEYYKCTGDKMIGTISLAREQLDMSYTEFLYASNFIVQEHLLASNLDENIKQEAAETLIWDALAILGRTLYVDVADDLAMSFDYASFRTEDHPLYGTHYVSFDLEEYGWERPADLEAESYQWLFDMGAHVDGYQAEAYPYLLADCLLSDPDAFIAQLSLRDDDFINFVGSHFVYTFYDEEELDTIKTLLDYMLSNGPVATERRALELLLQEITRTENDLAG